MDDLLIIKKPDSIPIVYNSGKWITLSGGIYTIEPCRSNPTVTDKHNCDDCGKKFDNMDEAIKHARMKGHSIDSIHYCQFCDKSFTVFDELYEHEQSTGHSMSQK